LGFAGARGLLPVIGGRQNQGRFANGKEFSFYHEPQKRSASCSISSLLAQFNMRGLGGGNRAGATAVQLFDTWCGELNLQDYEDFALPAVQRIIAGLGGSVPVIYYTKASQHLLPAVARSGANVLSVDWRVDLAEDSEDARSKIALQGNVDPASCWPQRNRERRLGAINSSAGEGHISNLGHGILQHTRRECSAIIEGRASERCFTMQGTAVR